MSLSRAAGARLDAAALWKYRHGAGDPDTFKTVRACSRQSRAPEVLRQVARPIVVSGTGWYLLVDKQTGEHIGGAHWADGRLTIYGPPWPGRRRAPNGAELEKPLAVKRPRSVWAALLALLGTELQADESPGDALSRLEKTERFQRLVK